MNYERNRQWSCLDWGGQEWKDVMTIGGAI